MYFSIHVILVEIVVLLKYGYRNIKRFADFNIELLFVIINLLLFIYFYSRIIGEYHHYEHGYVRMPKAVWINFNNLLLVIIKHLLFLLLRLL